MRREAPVYARSAGAPYPTFACVARQNGWTPEQLLVTVKEACYTSPDFVSLNSTSEREVLVASVVTGCITEFFEPSDPSLKFSSAAPLDPLPDSSAIFHQARS